MHRLFIGCDTTKRTDKRQVHWGADSPGKTRQWNTTPVSRLSLKHSRYQNITRETLLPKVSRVCVSQLRVTDPGEAIVHWLSTARGLRIRSFLVVWDPQSEWVVSRKKVFVVLNKSSCPIFFVFHSLFLSSPQPAQKTPIWTQKVTVA